jgi:putative spermidine/putrescine transport system permease protein
MTTALPTGLGAGTTGAAPRVPPVRRRAGFAGLAVAPFLLYLAVFFAVPVVMLVYGAFQSSGPNPSFTVSNMKLAGEGSFRTALIGSVKLSGITAVAGAVLGLGLAQLVVRTNTLKRIVLTASGVLANFGGVPLAFMFIATLGNNGFVTDRLHLGDAGFTLYGFWGLVLVYLYFLVPLMVLVITPALEGLRVQWHEAATNLGASRWQFWRYVGGPVLLPSLLGGLVLLFGSAFSAYATVRALMGASSVPIVTLYIASALSGNVQTNAQNVAFALSLDMILIAGVVMAVYLPLQRRTTRWLNN